MSAHTPGPWRWSPEGLRAGGQLILSRPWNVDPSTPDARLIVNAPELHEAVTVGARYHCLASKEHDTGKPCGDEYCVGCICRAALAKAAP